MRLIPTPEPALREKYLATLSDDKERERRKMILDEYHAAASPDLSGKIILRKEPVTLEAVSDRIDDRCAAGSTRRRRPVCSGGLGVFAHAWHRMPSLKPYRKGLSQLQQVQTLS